MVRSPHYRRGFRGPPLGNRPANSSWSPESPGELPRGVVCLWWSGGRAPSRWEPRELPAGLRCGWAELAGRASVRLGRTGRPGFVGVGPNWPAGGWRSPGSLGGPGGGGWRSAGSPLALAGEGSGIRGDPSEFKGRPIARLNRIGNLRASVEEFLEFARRGSANGTPLEVDSGRRFSSASGGAPGPPWNFSGRCAGHRGTRPAPGAHQAHTRRTPGNQPKTGVRRGYPLQRGHHCACAVGCSWRSCRGVQLASPAGLRWGWAELPVGLRCGWAELPSSLAPGRQGTSGPWSSGGSPPLVISRICRGIPGLRSRFRASSRGFPGKFLDGMAQN